MVRFRVTQAIWELFLVGGSLACTNPFLSFYKSYDSQHHRPCTSKRLALIFLTITETERCHWHLVYWGVRDSNWLKEYPVPMNKMFPTQNTNSVPAEKHFCHQLLIVINIFKTCYSWPEINDCQNSSRTDHWATLKTLLQMYAQPWNFPSFWEKMLLMPQQYSFELVRVFSCCYSLLYITVSFNSLLNWFAYYGLVNAEVS